MVRLSAIFVMLAVIWGFAPHAGAIEKGAKAPDIAISSEHSLQALSGDVVVVDFWVSWCATCRRSLPYLKKISEKYGERGLKVLSINLDQDSNRGKELVSLLGDKVMTVFDATGQIGESYGVNSLPSAFIVTRASDIGAVYGAIEESGSDSFERDLERFLGESNP